MVTIVTCFVLSSQSVYASQSTPPKDCKMENLTTEQAMDRYSEIVIVKIKSSEDQTEQFLKSHITENKDDPKQIEKMKAAFDLMAYVMYEAQVVETFKGSLAGDIKLIEIRKPTNLNGVLAAGFYYILGLNSDNSYEGAFILPDCTIISKAGSPHYDAFIEKSKQFRK
jgi:hypothetical protein